MAINKFAWWVVYSFLLLAVMATIAAETAVAQNGKAGEKAKAKAPTYTSKQHLPGDVTLAILSNGLTVIVQENHVAPVATVRCYVKNTGGAFEGKYLGAGLSHVLEHVVSGGTTKRRKEKEIEKIIDRFGGATNAFTSSYLTAYFIDCPSKDVTMAIDLVADSMQHVVFEPAEFARELKVVAREMADGEVNRNRVQWKMLNKTVYTVHPIRHPVIGYRDVLGATTNQTIIDFYRQRYIPNNQVFVVVGDVQTDTVLAEIAKLYAGTPRGRETFVPLPDEPEQITPRTAVREMDGTTYNLVFAWPTVKLAHDDLFALDVAAYILTEGESSRMVQRLKYDKQLVYSVDSASYTPHFAKGYFAIFASTAPKNLDKASAEIVREVYQLRNEPVGEKELAKAKKQKAAELVFDQQTVQQAAESLGRNYISTGDPLFDEKYVQGIQKVTAQQVQDVARRYFVPRRLNKIIIAPEGGAPKKANKQTGGASGEIRAERLSNGLRVLVQRHSHLPMVNIQAFVLGASLVDTEKTAGRSALVGNMLSKGTSKHSATEVANHFDSIGGQFSTAAGRFTVYASATTLREDFPASAALFAECFTQPTFPQDQFKKLQTLALGGIAQRANNPQAEIFETFYDLLPASSPYHVLRGGKKETVERLTAEDLRKYHAKYFVPNNMIVTVFGDIDPDDAIKLVKKNFGHLKSNPNFRPISFDRNNALPKTIVRHKLTGKKTGMVLLGYPATNIFNKKDYAALILLDAIMSGYSYPGGWLHNELRGQGLVYYVHAFQIAGPSQGYFTVLSQTQPKKIDEVVDRIKKNIQRAKDGKISKEEFQRAVGMVTSLHAQDNTTIAAKAQQAALNDLYGLGFDYDKSFDQRIQAVTRDDVIRVARKYLDKHVLVTSSPEKR